MQHKTLSSSLYKIGFLLTVPDLITTTMADPSFPSLSRLLHHRQPLPIQSTQPLLLLSCPSTAPLNVFPKLISADFSACFTAALCRVSWFSPEHLCHRYSHSCCSKSYQVHHKKDKGWLKTKNFTIRQNEKPFLKHYYCLSSSRCIYIEWTKHKNSRPHESWYTSSTPRGRLFYYT